MDEELRRRIAASLDLPEDSPADPEVARALEAVPGAEAYTRGLYVIERALRQWPARARSDDDWERAAARVMARIESEPARAKVKRGTAVSPDDFDATAAPVFDDGPAADHTESMRTMSEPQDNDADLEALAALTRTSLGPGAIPSTPPRAVGPSITDEVDETSSGIVDIKTLAAVARASVVPPAAEAKPAEEPKKAAEEPKKAAEEAKPAEAKKPAAEAKKPAKTDDVMVRPKAAAAPAAAVDDEAPRKGGGGFKGMLIGVAVSAAAFFIYTQTQSQQSPTAASSVSPEEGARTESASAPAPAADPAPTAAPAVAAEAPALPAAPTPEPVPAAAAAPAEPTAGPPAPVAAPVVQAGPPAPTAHAPEGHHAEAQHRAAAPRAARPGAAATGTAAPAPAAPAPAAPAPAAPAAPAARPAAAPAAAPAPAPRPAGGGGSVDDLMNQVAGGPARPAAAAPAPAEELPERLTRSQVTSVLGGLAGAVRQCAGGETGTAPFSITIANDGTVQNASLSGQFSGTPQGECMEGVVRRARFGRFRNPTQTLVYPYVIQPPR